MKRQDILKKLEFTVPPSKIKRVIISTDLNNEADDHFAVMHHLLTPSEDVKGIVAAHYEWSARIKEDNSFVKGVIDDENIEFLSKIAGVRGETMEESYKVGEKLLSLSNIDDVPLFRGASYEIKDVNNLPKSEGADFIIEEALKEDSRPLYIAVLGSITDVAIAVLKEPKIADKLTVIWIGGGPYPKGCCEFNLSQDVLAANIVFEKYENVWQVPSNVYSTVEVSQGELNSKIRPLGPLGEYLCQQMNDLSNRVSPLGNINLFPHGESWCLGDNPTVTVLLQGTGRICWEEREAPFINNDYTYTFGKLDKKIRVYKSVDSRLLLSDFYSKMNKCYGGNK